MVFIVCILAGALPLLAVASQSPSFAEPPEVERYTIGPEYTFNQAWQPCSDCEKGERFNLFMPIANTTYNCDPAEFPLLKSICRPNCGQKYGQPGMRNITVYVPAAYEDGAEAGVHIDVEGTDWDVVHPVTLPDGNIFDPPNAYANLMDNLIGVKDETRSLPPFIYVAVGLAGPGSADSWAGADNCGDGGGTPRAIELVTVSDAYAKFIANEVMPWVANHPAIKAKYPNFRFTDDPSGRVVQGQSNGGGAAFKMVFLRPDLFGTMIGYSPALIQQPYPESSDDVYPLNNAEFWVPPPEGQGLFATVSEPVEKARFYLNVNDRDLGTEDGCISGKPSDGPAGPYGNFVEGNNKTAEGLAKKGYEVRFVYGLHACHTDLNIVFQEAPNAMVWAWSDWKKKLESGGTPVADSTTASQGIVIYP